MIDLTAKPLELKEILEELWDIATEWKTLGTLLGIPFSDLSNLETKERYNNRDYLREMLAIWLRVGDPSWASLAEALHRIDKNLSATIKLKYLDNHCHARLKD